MLPTSGVKENLQTVSSKSWFSWERLCNDSKLTFNLAGVCLTAASIFSLKQNAIKAVTPNSLARPVHILTGCLLGYHFYETYKQLDAHRIYRQSKQLDTYQQTKGQEIGLILEAEDPQGSFKGKYEKIYIAKKLREAGLLPIFRKISNMEDIQRDINYMTERDNRIKVLWLRAHGSSSAITLNFSQPNLICSTTLKRLQEGWEKLPQDSTIVLQSCSTAKRQAGIMPIAEKIALALPGRTVFAAIEDLEGQREVKVTNVNPFTVQLTGSIIDNGCHHGVDLTKVYNFSNPKKNN